MQISRRGFLKALSGLLASAALPTAAHASFGPVSQVRSLDVLGESGPTRSRYFTGQMDEIRITKGVARYTPRLWYGNQGGTT